MKNTKEKAADYFKSNPGTAELFGTKDGTLFLMKQHAIAHSHTLEDKDVDTFVPFAEAVEMQLHTVTQEDLDANPELGENGVIVGDEIEFSAVVVKKVTAPKAKVVKKVEKPVAEQTPPVA